MNPAINEGITKAWRIAVSVRNMAVTCACGASMVSAIANANERNRNSRAGMKGVREVNKPTTKRLIHAENCEPGSPTVH